jgi:hypothetical protein
MKWERMRYNHMKGLEEGRKDREEGSFEQTRKRNTKISYKKKFPRTGRDSE